MTSEWLYWSGALISGAISACLLGLALFADRSRGRMRCRKCWFSMKNASSFRCPECGHTAKHIRQFHKTRRHWGWALASFLPLLLGAFLAVQPKVHADGWMSIVPTTVVIIMLRIDDREQVIDEIKIRITGVVEHQYGSFSYPTEDRLWRWQWRMLGRSVLKRLQDQHDPSTRRRFHFWLAFCSDYGESQRLRSDITEMLSLEFAHENKDIRTSATIYWIDYDDLDASIARAAELLDHETAHVRIAAIQSLAMMASDSEQVVAPLVELLTHKDPKTRFRALEAIAIAARFHQHMPDAYDAIMNLECDEHDDVRHLRVEALARLRSGDTLWEGIESALHSPDPVIRAAGLRSAIVRSVRPPEINFLMIEALDDEDDSVRLTASQAIRQVGGNILIDHIEVLRSYRDHPDENVRDAVRFILGRLILDE